MNKSEELKNTVAWINDNVSGIALKCDEKNSFAIGCFDIALEHQASISLLIESKLYGSAFALTRVLTESVVRGMWLFYCASENEIEKFRKGKLSKSYGTLITEIEVNLGNETNALSVLKKNTWNTMNDFTHTGYEQISRRHGEDFVGSNYSIDDINQTLTISSVLGLVAASQLAIIAESENIVTTCISKLSEIESVAL